MFARTWTSIEALYMFCKVSIKFNLISQFTANWDIFPLVVTHKANDDEYYVCVCMYVDGGLDGKMARLVDITPERSLT